MNSYRKNIYLSTYKGDEVELNQEYVDLSTVTEIVDEIESQVNEIISKLEPMEGFSEINNVKDLVDKLAKFLY